MKRAKGYLAHDVREDGARRADERADDGQVGRAEHEALRAERPAGVGVEHRDDHRLLWRIVCGIEFSSSDHDFTFFIHPIHTPYLPCPPPRWRPSCARRAPQRAPRRPQDTQAPPRGSPPSRSRRRCAHADMCLGCKSGVECHSTKTKPIIHGLTWPPSRGRGPR